MSFLRSLTSLKGSGEGLIESEVFLTNATRFEGIREFFSCSLVLKKATEIAFEAGAFGKHF